MNTVMVLADGQREEIKRFFSFLDSKKYPCRKSMCDSGEKEKIVIRYISNDGVKVDVFSGMKLEEGQFEEIYQKLINA